MTQPRWHVPTNSSRRVGGGVTRLAITCGNDKSQALSGQHQTTPTAVRPTVHTKGTTNVSTQLLVSERRAGHQSADATTDAILRALGVVTLMGLALVHIVQLVPTFQTMQLLGAGYLLLIAGTVVVSVRLITNAPTQAQLWAPVALFAVGAMVAYAFTRVFSTPLDNQDVGNWACTLGMAALFLEAALVALSAYAIATRSRARQVLHTVSDESTIAYWEE
jgi:hypothetical protein